MTDPTAALQGAAKELHASARAHKRSEFHHRKIAGELMRKLDELRTTCEQLGIQLNIDGRDPEEGHSHA